MAQTVGSPSLVLWAWAIAGLLSMAGALTYAELGAMLPHAGGEYVFLLEAYGEGPAFLLAGCGSSWIRRIHRQPGRRLCHFSCCHLADQSRLGGRPYHAFGETLVWRFGTQQVLAVAVIVVLSALNCGRVVLGGQEHCGLRF